MTDLEYKTWKIENNEKYILLDRDLYYSDFNNPEFGETKINFEFLKNNLNIKFSSDSLFRKYLLAFFNLCSKHTKSQLLISSEILEYIQSQRNKILKFKKLNVNFELKSDIYIEKPLYEYMQKRIEQFKVLGVNLKDNDIKFRLDDFNNISDALSSIVIPYSIYCDDGTNLIKAFPLLSLFICTNFSKYFFKANPIFCKK